MEYDKMPKEVMEELFRPLIEAAMEGLRKVKKKYPSFQEAWENIHVQDFLIMSYYLISNDHPYREFYTGMMEKYDVFGESAYYFYKALWDKPVEEMFGLTVYQVS